MFVEMGTVTMRILLVDDDPLVRELLSASLAQQGFTDVTRACSAEEALELIETDGLSFDCFLLDIMLDEMNGIELCRQLRQRAEFLAAPIIMITSSQATAFMDRAFDAGATDFLRKPLDQVEVAGRIRTAMLLVETTKQEKRGRQTLQALMSRATELDLMDATQRVCFPDAAGMMDYYQFENRLLRLQEGQYRMRLFRLQLDDFQKLAGRNDQAGILDLLHTISVNTSERLQVRQLWFAYIGAGRFIFCVLDSPDSVTSPVLIQLQDIARDATRDRKIGKTAQSLGISVHALSETRIMSRKTALAIVGREFDAAAAMSLGFLPKIDTIERQLFDKIDNIFSTPCHEK